MVGLTEKETTPLTTRLKEFTQREWTPTSRFTVFYFLILSGIAIGYYFIKHLIMPKEK